MLDVLTTGFKEAKLKLQGKATLSADNIAESVALIRKSLLEADVEYGVVRSFIERVQAAALGSTVQLKAGSGANKMRVTAADHFVKICEDELVALMSPVNAELNFAVNRPSLIMMVGLQGSGKTTSTGKLAKYLVEQKGRKPLLVAADIYRPAAVNQLEVIGQKLGIPVFHVSGANPVQICREAIQKAYELSRDTIILDTAGRLAIDAALMQELVDIKAATKPDNILLVCDAMMGQDAVATAKTFNDTLDLDGIIMTKLDGDARGGAALSIRQVTSKPIKFLGMGEDLGRLEEFRPEGLASRILGMGDVVGLMEDFSRVVKDDTEVDAMRMLQGDFTFEDFYSQLAMIQQMGPLKDLIAKLPMQDLIPKGMQIDDRELIRTRAMISSMTKQERQQPKLLNPSRIRRIARGSGSTEKNVTAMVTQFSTMRKMMAGFGKSSGLLGKIPGLGNLSQLNNMRKMAQQMGVGMPGMGDTEGAGAPKKLSFDRDKQRKVRKQARKARQKNRKK